MTEPATHLFRKAASDAVADDNLQSALDRLTTSFVAGRSRVVNRCQNFEALRDAGRDIRRRALQNLDTHLETFENNAERAGARLHWAETASDACRIIADLCKTYGARNIAKGKSMITEEIGLNAHLESEGLSVLETDLGEYLIQLRNETPSHIIAPAVHLSGDDVARTFRQHHTGLELDRRLSEPAEMVAEARQVLRHKFLEADVGITGANFLIAETGTAVVVTNEGNGDLCATLPNVHVIVTAIDKVVPSVRETAVLLQLLARSATGQDITAYISFFTGPRKAGDLDGPNECHIVLIDNCRSELLATDKADVLTCIRCGACLNHCPIYRAVGGHAYGWVYPGPIGAVLSPGLLGVLETADLPHASTLCGRCEDVCPVRIPIPKLLRQWRQSDHEQKGVTLNKVGLRMWRFVVGRPRLYRSLARIGARLLNTKSGSFKTFPLMRGWTNYRQLPSSQGETFQALWRQRRQKR